MSIVGQVTVWLGGVVDILSRGGALSVLILFTWAWLNRKVVTEGELNRVITDYEGRLRSQTSDYERRLQAIEERRLQWEKLAWDLVSTNRELAGSISRGTEVAEKAVVEKAVTEQKAVQP